MFKTIYNSLSSMLSPNRLVSFIRSSYLRSHEVESYSLTRANALDLFTQVASAPTVAATAALRQLEKDATEGPNLKAFYANKALSLIFHKGVSSPFFCIKPNQVMAEHYKANANKSNALYKQIDDLATRLKSVWFFRQSAKGELKKLADADNQQAQFFYGVRCLHDLDRAQGLTYLRKAACSAKRSPLTFKAKGNIEAIKLLKLMHDRHEVTLPFEETLQYQYDLVLHHGHDLSHPLISDLLSYANKGHPLACLQAGLLFLHCHQDEKKAAGYLDMANQANSKVTSFGAKLHEQLCLGLARFHESAQSCETLASLVKYHLSKAIGYLAQIPTISKKYYKAQERIGLHKSRLADESGALAAYKNSSEGGSLDCSLRALTLGFKKFCEKKQTSLPNFEPFYKEHPVPVINNPKSDTLATLELITDQLLKFNQQRSQSKQATISGVTQLQQDIQSLVGRKSYTESVVLDLQPRTIVLMNRLATIDPELNQEVLKIQNQHKKGHFSNLHFFTSEPTRAKKSLLYLGLMHKILASILSSPNSNELCTTFAQYVVKECQKILSYYHDSNVHQITPFYQGV